MSGRFWTVCGILAAVSVAAATLGAADHDATQRDRQVGDADPPVAVRISSGPDGMEGVAEFGDEGRIEVQRRGGELEMTIEGLSAGDSMQAAEFIMRVYREVQHGTQGAALESSPEWRNLESRCERAERRVHELERRTEQMSIERRNLQRRIHELEAAAERRTDRIEQMEEALEKRAEIIQDLSAAVEEMEAEPHAEGAE